MKRSLNKYIESLIAKLPYGHAIADYATMTFSTFLRMSLNFMKGFIVAKILGPTHFGTWKGIEVLQLYHQYTSLGTQNGMSREIPKLRGQGKIKHIELLRNSALGQILLLPLFVSIVFAVYAFSMQPGLIRFALLLTSINVIMLMVNNYFSRLYYADMRFIQFSKIMIAISIPSNAFAVFAAIIWNAKAPYIAVGVTELVKLVVLMSYGKYKIRPVFKIVVIFQLIRIGFPIMMVGLLYGMLTTVDRLIILTFMSPKDLGYYSLLLMIGVIYSSISNAMGEIVYPRMNQKFGKTGNIASLDFLLFIPGYIMSSILAIVSIFLIIGLSNLVPIFLEKYQHGVVPATIFIIGAPVGDGSILNTIGKQWISVAIQIVAFVINVVLSILLIKLAYGIIGVAIGTITSLIVYRIGVTVISFHYVNVGKLYILKRIYAYNFPAAIVWIFYVLYNLNPLDILNQNQLLFQIILSSFFIIMFSILLIFRIRSVFNQKAILKYKVAYGD